MQDCVVAGLLAVVPQLLASEHVLVCWLLTQVLHAEQVQLSVHAEVQVPEQQYPVVQVPDKMLHD